MRIASSLLIVILSLAACSPAGGPRPRTDADGVTYLRGVESEYSMRLDDLSSKDILAPDTAMRDALIAGDGEYYVAAALFQHEQYLTLDLIVLNHSKRPLEVDRSDLRIVDEQGDWLVPVDDYVDADQYGLRGKGTVQTSSSLLDAPSSASSNESTVSTEAVDGATQWKSGFAKEPPRNRRIPGADAAWRGAADPLQRAPNAPPVLRVASQEGRAYWGYWEAKDITYPLTAFVMLDDRHLIFRFDR
jgi:hypothetical protein